MRYGKVVKGIFRRRPNRFVAEVLLWGKEVTVHVKNTGRCRELLIPGAVVYLEDQKGKLGRKTRFSLIAVEKVINSGKTLLINMDSQAPNKVVAEGIAQGKIRLTGMAGLPSLIAAEKTYGDSRFDFYIEGDDGNGNKVRGFIEVKGVTLEDNGVAKFPDAPTDRGIKHLRGLMKAQEEGYRGWVMFVVQMEGVSRFEPNDETHKAFGDTLRKGSMEGVRVLAYDCYVKADELRIKQEVKVVL